MNNKSTTNKKLRAAVIGTGRRAASYFRHIPAELRGQIELVALADPSNENREAFARLYAPNNAPRHYEDGTRLLKEEDLDALVVCPPNHEHVAAALPAIERRIPLLLEKPVATNVEDCRRLWQVYNAASCPPVTVGFVLRYTPFYFKAKEIVDSGALGQLLTADGDEDIGTGTTRLFFGGWRRFDDQTGGFMIEKCSHDLDVLRWLVSSEAVRVTSFAQRTHFVPQSPGGRASRFESRPDDEMLDFTDATMNQLIGRSEAGSLYDKDGDVLDHQSAVIEWENGVLSCFTAAFGRPRTTRRLRMGGIQGTLEGDIGLGNLALETVAGDLAETTREEFSIEHDVTGHHGGDGNLATQFWNSCLRPDEWQEPRAGLREGIEAVIIGSAVHKAAMTGQIQDVAAIRRTVFD